MTDDYTPHLTQIAHARALLTRCEEQIKLGGEDAFIVLVEPGRVSPRRRRFARLPGAPLGEPLSDVRDGVAVSYSARELRDYIQRMLGEEKQP